MTATGETRMVSESNDEVRFEWKIWDFDSKMRGVGYPRSCQRFRFYDTWWLLGVHEKDESSESIDLYLRMVQGVGAPMAINVTLGIKRADDAEEVRVDKKFLFQKAGDQNFPNFLTTSELRRRKSELAPSNVVTVTCRLKIHHTPRIKKEKSVFTCDTGYQRIGPSIPIYLHAVEEPGEDKISADLCVKEEPTQLKGFDKLQLDFKKLLLSGEDSDVTLKVKGSEFRAHRIFLKARSAVFASMFTYDMLENASGVVDIDDCDPNTFPDFLQYLYAGRVEALTAKNVYSLYSAADKYNVQELKSECLEYMKSSFSVETFCDVMVLSLRYQEKELIQLATYFFSKNLPEIIVTVEWQKFLIHNPTVANELLITSLVPGKK